MIYISLVAGGGIGGLLRYLMVLCFASGSDSVIATLSINLSGCLLLGFFHRTMVLREMPIWLRTGLLTGIIGSYTTYSTFCVETERLVSSHPILALGYGLLSLGCGPILVYVGDIATASVIRRRVNPAEEVNA